VKNSSIVIRFLLNAAELFSSIKENALAERLNRSDLGHSLSLRIERKRAYSAHVGVDDAPVAAS
jgi:hypothetical protein